MAKHQKNRSPVQRLHDELKARPKDSPELKQFRSMLRDVLPLMKSAMNLVDFLDARRDLCLLNDPDILRCADNVERHCYQVYGERYGFRNGKSNSEKRVSNHEALCRRAARERNTHIPKPYSVRRSTASRMAAGFDKRLDELIKDAQRSG
ncbi:hypothetical protein [Synechococcus sp. PROS-U-1]|uniref:hypothetical protein n=1 Tax=Synechococcus sp. PROS-U-1 TaxID=1400866 RepID=UPI0016484842|nr:hypothetical protein [Synechococcus sp. PROS-U-1]